MGEKWVNIRIYLCVTSYQIEPILGHLNLIHLFSSRYKNIVFKRQIQIYSFCSLIGTNKFQFMLPNIFAYCIPLILCGDWKLLDIRYFWWSHKNIIYFSIHPILFGLKLFCLCVGCKLSFLIQISSSFSDKLTEIKYKVFL